MANSKHISEDEIKYIVDVESAKAQQDIHELYKDLGITARQLKKHLIIRQYFIRAVATQGKTFMELTEKITKTGDAARLCLESIARLYGQMNLSWLTMIQLRQEQRRIQTAIALCEETIQNKPSFCQAFRETLKKVEYHIAALSANVNAYKKASSR